MKKILFALALTVLGASSFAIDNNKRTDAIDSIGIVNVRTADTIVKWNNGTRPIRCIFADVGGIIRLRLKTYKGDTITTVMALNDATMYPVSQVLRVSTLYNGTDSTTCQVYDTAGVLRRGIKLGF